MVLEFCKFCRGNLHWILLTCTFKNSIKKTAFLQIQFGVSLFLFSSMYTYISNHSGHRTRCHRTRHAFRTEILIMMRFGKSVAWKLDICAVRCFGDQSLLACMLICMARESKEMVLHLPSLHEEKAWRYIPDHDISDTNFCKMEEK